MNEYKIEIWRYQSVIDTYKSNDINKILKWYRTKYKTLYDYIGCTFYLFKNNKELSFEKEYELGFYDE